MLDKYELECQEKVVDMGLSKLPERLSREDLPKVFVPEWEGILVNLSSIALQIACRLSKLGYYSSFSDGILRVNGPLSSLMILLVLLPYVARVQEECVQRISDPRGRVQSGIGTGCVRKPQ
jgi:hypothetical protein